MSKIVICIKKRQGSRIVNGRFNTFILQVILKMVAVMDSDHIKMKNVTACWPNFGDADEFDVF